MTEKIENFITRLRWKVCQFCKGNSQAVNESANGYFGFKTSTTTPPNEHLNAFENDLYGLNQKVEFANVQNTFQQKLKSSNNMLVCADKSTKLYELSRDHYQKLLHDNTTQTYQKTSNQTKKTIDRSKEIC